MTALLLVGSPKGRDSASHRLGARLAERLRERGAAVVEEFVHQRLRSESGTARLLETLDGAELVIVAFPLYVDALPAPLTRLLELVALRRAAGSPAGAPRLAVVVQCGFPEAHQCDTAVAICRLFAERTGMRWAGALAMGMGGSIGRDIRKLPGGGKNTLDALDRAAAALAAGGEIPAEAAGLFARPLMPRWLYNLGGNLGWRALMWKNRTRRPIAWRPHRQD